MADIFVISGPNGSGKTTSAMSLFPDLLECMEFVNADSIASGISPFQPELVDNTFVFGNSLTTPIIIAEKAEGGKINILNLDVWQALEKMKDETCK